MNATSIGILGILFSLLGALLVIDKLLTFRSVIKRFDNISAVYFVKYFRRISFNLLDQYLKLEPDATDKDLVITLRNRIRNDKPPDVGEWKEILEEWKEMKHETRSQISQKKRLEKKFHRGAIKKCSNDTHYAYTQSLYFPLNFCRIV